jgi:hypothetical protein
MIAIGVTPLLLSLVRDSAAAFGLAYPREWSKPPLFYVITMASLTVSVLAPSLLARWRTSRLLYPTQYEIWLERLLLLAELLVGIVVLAYVAHWTIDSGITAACGVMNFFCQ